ncbi:MAG: hypothetical protein K2J78_05445, partial [Muribaculaceae bacterium]|nr:hypothetical protein [Muribaculaceae bacterium]
ILDREYTALSKKCATRLNKVEKQLSLRYGCLSKENVHDESKDLSAMTVDELYNLYRGWHLRHRKREVEGRELITFYYEGKIVKELQRRKPTDNGEQLKIDYCTITYRNELENMSFIFSLPVISLSAETRQKLACLENGESMTYPEVDNGLIYPEPDRAYTPLELLAVIKLYSHFRDITERELLIEYVDMALDLMLAMETPTDKIPYMALASELVEIGRKGIIRVPGWVSGFLKEAVEAARKDKTVRESELVLPLLTLQLQNGSPKLEREARRIINRCYRRATALDGDVDILVEDLYVAVSCCDYVSRFSVKKMGRSWNELADRTIVSVPDSDAPNTELNTRTIIRLLKVANEIGDYVAISPERKALLTELLELRAASNDIEARAYLLTLPIPMAKAV